MQIARIDIEDWDASVGRISVPEAALLDIINDSLQMQGRELACVVTSLRHVDRPGQNWAIAAFRLGHSEVKPIDERLDRIARIIANATTAHYVDWPSVRLH